MAIESVSNRFAASNLDQLSKRELQALVSAMVNALQALTAKLDADATVTDTDYAAVLATFIKD